jgi:hypothetical protein
MQKELVNLILLKLGSASDYFHAARQVCRYTRSVMMQFVDVRKVECVEDCWKIKQPMICISCVWKGQRHPHLFCIANPFFAQCYDGEIFYLNGLKFYFQFQSLSWLDEGDFYITHVLPKVKRATSQDVALWKHSNDSCLAIRVWTEEEESED